MIGIEEVLEARQRISGRIRRTPVLVLEKGALPGLEVKVALKLESLQETGAFKLRGALNLILASKVPPSGVVAASGGNHGAAVAAAARALGHNARIYVPEVSPEAKVQRIRKSGAEVVVSGANYGEAKELALVDARERGALDVPAYDHPLVAAGQGTLALELYEDFEVDTLFTSVGGGGLLAGCTAALTSRGVKLIGVETPGCACLHAALHAGAPVDVEVSGIAIDSLGARRLGELPFEVIRAAGVTAMKVSDEMVRRAQKALWEGCRVAAEPGGAAALAVLLFAYRPRPKERVGVVISGANLDPKDLAL